MRTLAAALLLLASTAQAWDRGYVVIPPVHSTDNPPSRAVPVLDDYNQGRVLTTGDRIYCWFPNGNATPNAKPKWLLFDGPNRRIGPSPPSCNDNYFYTLKHDLYFQVNCGSKDGLDAECYGSNVYVHYEHPGAPE